MALKYVIIQNWSSKNQQALINQSSLDLNGVAAPVESIRNDMAMLEFDDENSESIVDISNDADLEAFTLEQIREELDTLDWKEDPSEGGEI